MVIVHPNLFHWPRINDLNHQCCNNTQTSERGSLLPQMLTLLASKFEALAFPFKVLKPAKKPTLHPKPETLIPEPSTPYYHLLTLNPQTLIRTKQQQADDLSMSFPAGHPKRRCKQRPGSLSWGISQDCSSLGFGAFLSQPVVIGDYKQCLVIWVSGSLNSLIFQNMLFIAKGSVEILLSKPPNHCFVERA